MTPPSDVDRPGAAEPSPPKLSVRGPGELIEVVPYLLGFHPERSLVLVGLCAGRVVVTARLDLPDAGQDGSTAAPVLSETVTAMHRGGAVEFVGLVFDEVVEVIEGAVLPWHGLFEQLADVAPAVGAVLRDAVLVTHGRFWSYTCADPRCCPRDGTPVTASSAVAAAAIYTGLVALPHRAAVAALLDPLPAGDRERLLPAIADAENAAVQAALDGRAGRQQRSVTRALFAAARDSARPGLDNRLPPVADAELARFGAALSSHRVRNAVWLAVDDRRLDGRALWRALARALPDPYAATPYFLFGWASWRAGDGALARIAAERALGSDPAYGAADLLTAALSYGLDPRRLPRLRRSA